MKRKIVTRNDGSKAIIETSGGSTGIVGNLPSEKDKTAPTPAQASSTNITSEKTSPIDYASQLPKAVLDKLVQHSTSDSREELASHSLAELHPASSETLLRLSQDDETKVRGSIAQEYNRDTVPNLEKKNRIREALAVLETNLAALNNRWTQTIHKLVKATGENDMYAIDKYNDELDFLLQQTTITSAVQNGLTTILNLEETFEGDYLGASDAVNSIYLDIMKAVKIKPDEE